MPLWDRRSPPTHPAWGRAHLRRLLVDLGGPVAGVGVGDDSGGGEGLAIASGCHVLLGREGNHMAEWAGPGFENHLP